MKFNCITSACFEQNSDQAQEAINCCYIKASARRQERIKKEINGQVVNGNERMDEMKPDQTRPSLARYETRKREESREGKTGQSFFRLDEIAN